VLFSPRVVVQLVGFEGGAYHHSRRCRLLAVGLHPLPEGLELCACETPRAGEASRRRALRHPTPSQHQGGRALPGVRKDRPGQQGGVAIAGPTALGGKMAWGTEQAPLGVPTVRTDQAIRVEMLGKPKRAAAVIQ
jgi:hypothetical protein